MRWLLLIPFFTCLFLVCCYGDDSSDFEYDLKKRTRVRPRNGFGRVLTWNVKKLGVCLYQDNVSQLKDVICAVIQSANVIALQEASNLDFSCLPCNSELKDNYIWDTQGGMSSDLKLLIKTKKLKTIRVIKEGMCRAPSKLRPSPTMNVNPVNKETLGVEQKSDESKGNEIRNELSDAHQLVDKLLIDYVHSKDFESDMNKNNNDKKTSDDQVTNKLRFSKDDNIDDRSDERKDYHIKIAMTTDTTEDNSGKTEHNHVKAENEDVKAEYDTLKTKKNDGNRENKDERRYNHTSDVNNKIQVIDDQKIKDLIDKYVKEAQGDSKGNKGSTFDSLRDSTQTFVLNKYTDDKISNNKNSMNQFYVKNQDDITLTTENNKMNKNYAKIEEKMKNRAQDTASENKNLNGAFETHDEVSSKTFSKDESSVDEQKNYGNDDNGEKHYKSKEYNADDATPSNTLENSVNRNDQNDDDKAENDDDKAESEEIRKEVELDKKLKLLRMTKKLKATTSDILETGVKIKDLWKEDPTLKIVNNRPKADRNKDENDSMSAKELGKADENRKPEYDGKLDDPTKLNNAPEPDPKNITNGRETDSKKHRNVGPVKEFLSERNSTNDVESNLRKISEAIVEQLQSLKQSNLKTKKGVGSYNGRAVDNSNKGINIDSVIGILKGTDDSSKSVDKSDKLKEKKIVENSNQMDFKNDADNDENEDVDTKNDVKSHERNDDNGKLRNDDKMSAKLKDEYFEDKDDKLRKLDKDDSPEILSASGESENKKLDNFNLLKEKLFEKNDKQISGNKEGSSQKQKDQQKYISSETESGINQDQHTYKNDKSGNEENLKKITTDEKESVPQSNKKKEGDQEQTSVVVLKSSKNEESDKLKKEDPIMLLKDIQTSIEQLKEGQIKPTNLINEFKTTMQKQMFTGIQNMEDVQNELYVDSLKNRLAKSKQKLRALSAENDRYKTIENQIRFIERELAQFEGNPQDSNQKESIQQYQNSRIRQHPIQSPMNQPKLIKSVYYNEPLKSLNHQNQPTESFDSNSRVEQKTDRESLRSQRPTEDIQFTFRKNSREIESEIRPKSEGYEELKSQQLKQFDQDSTLDSSEEINLNKGGMIMDGESNSLEHVSGNESVESMVTHESEDRKTENDSSIKVLVQKIINEEKQDNKDLVKDFVKDSMSSNKLKDKLLHKVRSYHNRLKRVRIPQDEIGEKLRSAKILGKQMSMRVQNGSLYHDFEIVKRGFLDKANSYMMNNMNSEVINYELISVTSDLNHGQSFLIINVRLPKERVLQASCIDAIRSDVENYNQDKRPVFILGDFHLDRMSAAGSQVAINLHQVLANLQINGQNFYSPITYHRRDPITTVFGRRYDNILTNVNLKHDTKVIGPEFPLPPDSLVLSLTLQRLYNNYVTALYNTDSNEPEGIFECIKAFQTSGMQELGNNNCRDSWVPSSYVSDHLPLEVTIKLSENDQPVPVDLKFASWNVQGDTLRERLQDPEVKKKFQEAIKRNQVMIFSFYIPSDENLFLEGLNGNIVRLKQGTLVTDFSIYIDDRVKESNDDTEMFVMRKKNLNENSMNNENLPTDHVNLISTVGLFTPSLQLQGKSLRACFYTVRSSSDGGDLQKILDAIDKDVRNRQGCDFKLLLASLYIDGSFNIDKELYDSYKYINLDCNIIDGPNKYKYNVPRSRDLSDYIIVLEKSKNITFGNCHIELPGDEKNRGMNKLSDFEELSTHYPLSMVVRDIEAG